MTDYVIAVVIIVSFWLGLVTGYLMHRSAHKDGVKLMDRVKHGDIPYESEYEEQELGQKTTGGNFEPLFERTKT